MQTIHTNIGQTAGPSGDAFVRYCLNTGSSAGLYEQVKAPMRGVPFPFAWSESTRRAIHFVMGDTPDGLRAAPKYAPAYNLFRHNIGGDMTIIQAVPNGCWRDPTGGANIRLHSFPSSPVYEDIMEGLNETPDFDDKPLDIFTSWTVRTQWRKKVTIFFCGQKWDGMNVLMTARNRPDYPNNGKPITDAETKAVFGIPKSEPCGRFRWTKATFNNIPAYTEHLKTEVLKSKVCWDGITVGSAPATSRFPEAAWGGVCVIREYPYPFAVYRPGIDYLVIPDAKSAFDMAIWLVKSGEWRKYAENIRRTYAQHHAPLPVARLIAGVLEGDNG